MTHHHDFELDLDGQLTCIICGAKSEAGYSTGKWSDDDDAHPTITPIFGPNR